MTSSDSERYISKSNTGTYYIKCTMSMYSTTYCSCDVRI